MKSILASSIVIAAAVALSASSLSAATVQFNVSLDGTQSGTGSPAVGTATAVFDTTTGGMTITGSFSGLTGPSSNAHLHGLTSSAGTGSAGVLIGLTFDSGVTAGSFSGSGTIGAGNIAGVLAGQSYINLHSTENPGGEIRGFLTNPVPEPTAPALLVLGGLAGLGLRRRRA